MTHADPSRHQLGDELNSLTFSLSTLWFIGCQYQHHWAVPNQCNPNGTYWTAVLLATPAFLRFTQCFRRWSDSDYVQRIHLINAGKYASVILQYFTYLNYRYHGSSRRQDLALWATFATIYSVYTSSWDILLDWSLCKPHAKRFLLRDELCFEDVWPWYYGAMVSQQVAFARRVTCSLTNPFIARR
jgi:xenotropic and polytropic retrovirus receptor 1